MKSVLLIAVVLLLALGAAFEPILAHDPEHPELDDWYSSLKNMYGHSCCDGSDAVSVLDPDWERQDKPHSHYRVRLDVSATESKVDMQWVDVPDDALVDDKNRAGVTKVWPYLYSQSGGPTKMTIRCFMPGSMT